MLARLLRCMQGQRRPVLTSRQYKLHSPIHALVPSLAPKWGLCRHYSNQAEKVDILQILENGRHFCPGCGAQFVTSKDEKVPGWVDIGRLHDRTRWAADAPIGSPQLLVSKSRLHAIPNKFIRQSDWFNREYTRAEAERVRKRFEIPEGHANTLLQQLLDTEKASAPTIKKSNDRVLEKVPKRSDRRPLMEELGSEEILMDIDKFNEFAEELGAVNKKDLSEMKDTLSPLICQRCHDLKSNENISTLAEFSSDGPQLLLSDRDKRIIHDEMNSRSLIVMVVDLIDIPFSIPASALSLLKPHLRYGEEFPNILIVGNKLDLLPKNLRRAEPYLLQLARSQMEVELRKKLIGVHLVSAKESDGMSKLQTTLLKIADERDGNIFLLGRTNVGKSFVLNSLFGKKNQAQPTATVSAKAGTTIGTIKARLKNMPCSDESIKVSPLRSIVDLPGIIDNSTSLLSVLTAKEAKKAIISNKIKCQNRKLAPGETSLFGGLIRITCEGIDPKIEVLLKLYMRQDWYYFRMSSTKVPEFIENNLGYSRPQPPHLIPPLLEGIKDPRRDMFANPAVALEITVTGEHPSEIVFSDGIGWISAHLIDPSHKVKLTVYTPKGLGVTSRPCLAKYL